jgi:hypothetical protein
MQLNTGIAGVQMQSVSVNAMIGSVNGAGFITSGM